MPNRILKESICNSETLDSLSLEAENFFYRLIVQCDDYGRMDGRPAVLASRCYELRRELRAEQVAGWLGELVQAGLDQEEPR